ncbi:hypothetical protein MRX96_040159 [Rhipicephalus microplus]
MFGRGRMGGRRAGVVLAGGSSGEAAVVPLSFSLHHGDASPSQCHCRFQSQSSVQPRSVSRLLSQETCRRCCFHPPFHCFLLRLRMEARRRAYLVLHPRPLLDSMTAHLPQQSLG